MEIIINGANGTMGRKLRELIDNDNESNIAALVSPSLSNDDKNKTYNKLVAFSGKCDGIIDFSNHEGTRELLDYALNRKLPLVIATTGQNEAEKEAIAMASKSIPIFYSANMSLGVFLTAKVSSLVASYYPDGDIEIVETHHNRKKDVPSGTALLIAEKIRKVRKKAELLIGRHENGARTKDEIGIHSIRIANEVGTHEVLISNGLETITIKHEAKDRSLFALGALNALKWLKSMDKGLYNMDDLIGKED